MKVLSVIAMRALIPAAPTTPEPTRTSVNGAPSTVRLLSVTSWPPTKMPCIRVAFGTAIRSPLMLTRAGTGARMFECVR